ncbi:small RNA 2'-O-methyltransferase-like isoform X2 [Acanthaster planci]|uniref:Small RNA 2'-O-methyltransferase n=1 Tax=Acanthaster planci TaxID=133434 RepID=A0A8B7YXN7_ACAPL|nr:small RNA 2'-O-methyltransferase-like isoform X2 [Acanthaster planci]
MAEVTEVIELKFTPPVSVQRYKAVKNMVKKLQPKKVLDMGCGECCLLRQLKHNDSIEQLTGVDVDGDVLQAHRYLAKPLTWEYLNPRSHPFIVSLYQGSIGEKDSRMLGYDLVLCVEIIEHLYPDTLAAVPEVMFGFMRPQTVVFTTPNADFNVLFPDFQGFRHWDHKFEWSREEFRSWGNQVASDYGYTVTYEGIGAGPPGTEHLGCCTQMAVFTCKSPPKEGSRQHDCSGETPYNLICEVKYPHRAITTTPEEQILKEATFYLRRLCHTARQGHSEGENGGSDNLRSDDGTLKEIEETEEERMVSVSLETLMKFSCLRRVCPSVEKLREVLTSCESMSVSEDGESVLCSIEDHASESGNQSDASSTSETEAQVYERSDSKESDLLSWQQQEESWDW